jgi:hypothetical protein
MGAEQSKPKGPDLAQGVAFGSLVDGGMIGGHVGDDAVLLARRGDELFAIGSTCSHYGGPLAEGLIVGETVRCPWHHAVSASAPVKRWRRLRLIRCRAGAWRGATAKHLCARKSSRRKRASPPERHPGSPIES